MNTVELTKEWKLLENGKVYRNSSNDFIQITSGTPTEDSKELNIMPNETFKVTENIYAKTKLDKVYLIEDYFSTSGIIIKYT